MLARRDRSLTRSVLRWPPGLRLGRATALHLAQASPAGQALHYDAFLNLVAFFSALHHKGSPPQEVAKTVQQVTGGLSRCTTARSAKGFLFSERTVVSRPGGWPVPDPGGPGPAGRVRRTG
jgi:hypothetical protein